MVNVQFGDICFGIVSVVLLGVTCSVNGTFEKCIEELLLVL